MSGDEDLEHLIGPWITEFNPRRGWMTQCEKCDAPLVVETGLYPVRNINFMHESFRHEGALCDGCAHELLPERFQRLCEARDRHLQERPFEER